MLRLLPMLLSVVLVGCGAGTVASAEAVVLTSEPTEVEPLVITGTFTLHDVGGIRLVRHYVSDRVIGCEGSGGYSDVKAGLGVVVTNEVGHTIGSTQLSHDGLEEIGSDDFCALAFEVEVAPAEFYSIEISGRGELTYSHAELEAAGWEVIGSMGE